MGRVRFLYILVMFDLPTKTKSDRKKYSKFRKNILKDGFSMIQYSIYIRICKNNYSANAHIQYVKSIIPIKGEVRILRLTDEVYNSMQIFVGFDLPVKSRTNEEKIGIQTVIEF